MSVGWVLEEERQWDGAPRFRASPRTDDGCLRGFPPEPRPPSKAEPAQTWEARSSVWIVLAVSDLPHV